MSQGHGNKKLDKIIGLQVLGSSISVRITRALQFSCFVCNAINNCPMVTSKPIIQRAIEAAGSDAALQMQLIRRIHEDLFGGTFGVLIIKNAELVSNAVHWTIPDHRHDDGTPAFCLTIENGWQYNIFKTGNADSTSRMTVHEVVNRIQQEKQKPERLSVNEFDKKIAAALVKRRQAKLSVADDG
ncbi:hypothetical protein M3Y95_00214300 [Aphelenchoides besseyi]|nr:hypothetical protein M3Y95_00214300 [Aphelenchoides besseyi]